MYLCTRGIDLAFFYGFSTTVVYYGEDKLYRSILYKWRNEHPGKAKCRELAQALCNVDMNIDAILADVD
jgi:hypothetical protein